MIEEREIREGNWYHHNKEWCYRADQITFIENAPFDFQWDARDWYAVGECTMNINDCEAIPVTPELLEQAGLIKINNYNDVWEIFADTPNSHFEIIHLPVRGWEIQKRNSMDDSPVKICSLEYFHQLQNIIYDLCKVEITLKETA